MMFQQGAADTLNFMLLGMGAILGLMLVYTASLVVRWRSSQRELELLRKIDEDSGGGDADAAGSSQNAD